MTLTKLSKHLSTELICYRECTSIQQTPNVLFLYTNQSKIQKLYTGSVPLHPTGVMKCLQGPKVPPCWGESVLEEVTTSLTGGLEEFAVAA